MEVDYHKDHLFLSSSGVKGREGFSLPILYVAKEEVEKVELRQVPPYNFLEMVIAISHLFISSDKSMCRINVEHLF